MDDFKKKVHAFDAKIAFAIGAGCALLAFIFFLVLPVFGHGIDITGVKLFSNPVSAPLPLCLMLICLLVGPLAFIALGFLKKEFPAFIALILFIMTFFVATYYGSILGDTGMGTGTIFNLILYLVAFVFAYFRKGAPVSIN